MTFVIERILERFPCLFGANDAQCHCCFVADEKARVGPYGFCQSCYSACITKLTKRKSRFVPYKRILIVLQHLAYRLDCVFGGNIPQGADRPRADKTYLITQQI